MLTSVQIPGHGPAAVGLDWTELPGLDGRGTEIQQLGRTVDAAWQYVWSTKEAEREYVAFASRKQSRIRPVAAGALVQSALSLESYLTLIDIGEDQLWLFAVSDGLPQPGMDMVGDPYTIVALARDHLNKLHSVADVPIYTNTPDLLQALPYDLDLRAFSLEILGHSLKPRDLKRARFRRFTTAPVVPLVACALVVLGALGYYLYQVKVEEDARRNAALIRERAIEQRKKDLAAAVSAAINTSGPARATVPAYLKVVGSVRRVIGGWKLTEVECSGPGCTLTYKAQAFATWSSYLKEKPTDWPWPLLDSDIDKVLQPIDVALPDWELRTAEGLPKREQVRLDLGNLAQRSRAIKLALSIPTTWARVAGNPAQVAPDEQWIPMMGVFGVTGPAPLLGDLVSRLPDTTDITSLNFKLDESNTFDLKGKAYANP
ncbi:type 4b pilus protein PilO2 [Pseudomonas guariconensis]|uniref:type 4b pilus protein PilO2 n=1 Tax=Pseudomonas guariconensis TaxID=1288410 RepID=UPI003EE38949